MVMSIWAKVVLLTVLARAELTVKVALPHVGDGVYADHAPAEISAVPQMTPVPLT